MFAQSFARIAQTGDDLVIGKAIFEHEVDLAACGLRERGDFAAAAALEGEAEEAE